MKQANLIPLIALTATGLLAGCAAHRDTAGRAVTATLADTVLTPDSADRIDVDLTFHIPAQSLARRARLIITPQLVSGDTVREEYMPLVVDADIYGKKTRRKEVLEGYQDPYAGTRRAHPDRKADIDLPYHHTAVMPQGIETARLRAIVSEDGCGQCTGIDTLLLASVANPVTLVDEEAVKESFDLAWIEPEFVVRPKVRQGSGTARLQFVINKYDIRPELGNNRAELERMVADLGPVIGDSLATLTSLSIHGMASADGPWPYNDNLARQRAREAKRWLTARLGLDNGLQARIETGSRPEGWWPVYEAMRADGHPDSLAVKRILETYTEGNDDVQEQHIRRLACWPDIRAKYLQKDRKVVYAYTYTLRSFTEDAEMLRMYETRPDAFNEDELLRVAHLVKDDEEKMMEVYRTIQHYFPQNKVAANNLAVLHLRRGETDKAREALALPGQYSPEMLNALAASYVWKGDHERAIELLATVDTPQARYNLGLLKAFSRRLPEAYELLRPYRDLNAVIAALSVDRNREADDIMKDLTDNSPKAYYVRALIAARLNRPGEVCAHLKPALADPALKARAHDDPDFDPYRDSPQFKEMMKNDVINL